MADDAWCSAMVDNCFSLTCKHWCILHHVANDWRWLIWVNTCSPLIVVVTEGWQWLIVMIASLCIIIMVDIDWSWLTTSDNGWYGGVLRIWNPQIIQFLSYWSFWQYANHFRVPPLKKHPHGCPWWSLLLVNGHEGNPDEDGTCRRPVESDLPDWRVIFQRENKPKIGGNIHRILTGANGPCFRSWEPPGVNPNWEDLRSSTINGDSGNWSNKPFISCQTLRLTWSHLLDWWNLGSAQQLASPQPLTPTPQLRSDRVLPTGYTTNLHTELWVNINHQLYGHNDQQ